MKGLLAAGALLGVAVAQNGNVWEQCGGIDFRGKTTCVSGNSCVYLNDWYSQCQPGAAPTTTTSSKTTSGPAGPTSAPGKFKYFGVNEAGGEFGENSKPGVWGKDFIFPDTNAIKTLIGQGYNIFRVGFLMERLVPNSMTGSMNAAYLANMSVSINAITNAGAYAILDPHNFGRYYGNVITSTSNFKTFWQTIATPFKDNSRVIFDTNNEYHDMDQSLVVNLNQAAIDGIRAAGAKSQTIFVEGNSWTGAWTWESVNGNTMGNLKDPENKIVYQMHQYLDTDGSGTHVPCVSSTIGVERVSGATRWLKANGKKGILGEFAGGANDVCKQAVKGMLDHLKDNSDVWTGALWWAGGPWWGDYMYSFEPPSGTGYKYYNDLLKTYTP